MNKPLSVLIVEDDQCACTRLIEYADTKDNVTIIGATNNTTKALEYIRNYLPDAIILDLELHFGSGSGLQLLQDMHQLQLDLLPFILITTNNSSAVTYEYARQLGADYILYKHQEDYSEALVINFLLTMKNVIQNRMPQIRNVMSFTQPPAEKEKQLVKRISTELNFVGISPKAVGYQYLIDAILIAIEKKTQNISTIIGERYGKTEGSVERAMQNAISRAWRSTDIDDLIIHYTARINSDKGVPTVTEFIYYYASKIKNDFSDYIFQK